MVGIRTVAYYARTKPNTFNGRVLKADAPRESSYMHNIVNATMETGCSVLSFADNEMYPYSVGHKNYRATYSQIYQEWKHLHFYRFMDEVC